MCSNLYTMDKYPAPLKDEKNRRLLEVNVLPMRVRKLSFYITCYPDCFRDEDM
jgi:hypothetical protein